MVIFLGLSLLVFLLQAIAGEAWTTFGATGRRISRNRRKSLAQSFRDEASDATSPSSSASNLQQSNHVTRRSLPKLILQSSTALSLLLSIPSSSNALVKGNAPPPPKSKSSSSSNTSDTKKKCTNLEDCQALAEQQAERERQEALANATPVLVTPGGTRYRDLELGDTASPAVAAGMSVDLSYKVLKLGKRSYDGLSGEGTVVFSRGYGLEDDEDKPGVKLFRTTVGSPFTIQALNDALIGMHVGGVRRFAVLPQKGWRKPEKFCDGGPGGSGQGGELKTDYVVVPTATMVAEEACFDQTKQPFPVTYAEQRRMAQRFDQSLIMEVQVMKVGPGDDGL